MFYKENFGETKKYFRAFWAGAVLDRPLIAVTAPLNVRAVPVPYLSGACDNNYLPALKQFETYAENTYFAGESLPAFDISLGPDQYAAFLGGDIIFGEGTTWVGAFWDHNWNGRKINIDTKKGGYFNRLISAYKTVADYANGRFLINMADLHGNLDALSAARGPENLCTDLYDSPDEIGRAVNAVVDTFPFVVDSIAAAGNMDKNGYIGWAPTYCEEKFAVLQCDFSCMLSPQMARKYVMPALEREAAHLKRSVYHYDGVNALGHLDDILAIKNIDVIQWVPGTGNPRTIEWIDLLRKIQKAGKGVWIYDWTPEEIMTRHKELSPEKLIFQVSAATPQHADELVNCLKKKF